MFVVWQCERAERGRHRLTRVLCSRSGGGCPRSSYGILLKFSAFEIWPLTLQAAWGRDRDVVWQMISLRAARSVCVALAVVSAGQNSPLFVIGAEIVGVFDGHDFRKP